MRNHTTAPDRDLWRARCIERCPPGSGSGSGETDRPKGRNRAPGRLHRPPIPVIVAFINDHRERFGVEPICRVLTEHGCKIAPSTFYDNLNRQASKRKLRDAELIELIKQARKHRFVKLFGARKMWLHLRRLGHDVARCTVERLMTQMGISGVVRGKKPRTTIPDEKANRPADRVDRRFVASAPNRLWVADFERHEALLNRAVVKGHRRWLVAASRLTLRAA